MGWCSGTGVFDPVVKTVIEETFDERVKRAVLKSLIEALQNHDWDCESDSEYYDHPLIQSLFRELNPDWFDE